MYKNWSYNLKLKHLPGYVDTGGPFEQNVSILISFILNRFYSRSAFWDVNCKTNWKININLRVPGFGSADTLLDSGSCRC